MPALNSLYLLTYLVNLYIWRVLLCNTEAMFTKSVPSTMKMTVKGGAAVDPDSGIIGSLSVFASLSLQSFLAL